MDDGIGLYAAPGAAKPGRGWQKTSYANLIRYVPSGIYYARLRVKGKLIRLAGFGRRVCRRTGFTGETAAGIFLKMISRVDFIL
jgi:hypothetical protein